MKTVWAWLVCLGIAAVVLVCKLGFTYDLALFLPPPKTASQKVLIEQVGQSPGASLLLIGIKDAEDGLILEVRDQLRASSSFLRVQTDLDEISLDSVPESILKYRLLLTEIDFSAAGLTETLEARQADLLYLGGTDFIELIATDPQLVSLSILESISAARTNKDEWLTKDGYRVILAQTARSAFDIQAQNQASSEISAMMASADPTKIWATTGVGAFSSQLEQTISREATLRSILASIGMAMVLWVAYRRFSVLLLAALPLGTGALLGLCALSIFFDKVHGITLAFGFTLLGVAIDYPLHLFSHARRQTLLQSKSDISHAMITGLLSTLIAYLAIAFTGSVGLAQLGLFTAVGLIGAGVTTLYVLPHLKAAGSEVAIASSDKPSGIHLRVIALSSAFVVVVCQTAYLALEKSPHGIWNNDLSSLSPVPTDALLRDQSFRTALGTPDLRFLLTLRDPDLQMLLQQTESLDEVLQEAEDQKVISGWNSVSALVPSEATQERRRSTWPDSQSLRAQITEVSSTLGFRQNAFGAFVEQVDTSKSLRNIGPEAYEADVLENYINSYLYQTEAEWVSMVSLFELSDPEALIALLQNSDSSAVFVDLKRASETLVADYRASVLRLLAVSFFAVAALLLLRVAARRALWCLLNVVLGVLFTGLCVLLINGQLDLYHLIALLLVAGLGLDYSLFLSKDGPDASSRRDIVHATTACTVSTVVVFAILGTSSIPALNSLGTTVALGSLVSFLLAKFGSQVRQQLA